MSTFDFQPDDPRLTAYALGELDPAERILVEAMLAESAEARTALEEIRETIGLLSRELTFEPALTLTSSQRQSVEQAASPGPGERLGVSLPSDVANRALVRGPVKSTSRWNVIARTAATVATVAAVAVAVPYVSQSLRFDGVSRATSESTMASAELTSRTDSIRAVAKDEGTNVTSGIESTEVRTTDNESLAQTTMPGPRREPGDQTESTGYKELTDVDHSGLLVYSSQNASPGDAVEGTPPGARLLPEAVTALTANSKSEPAPPFAAELANNLLSDELRMKVSSEDSKIPVQLSLPPNSVAFSAYSAGLGGRGIETPETAREELLDLGRRGEMIERIAVGSRNESAPGTEAYEPIVENAFLTPMEQPLSTFSIDVDTASYANMRRFIQQGQLPPANAVRIEELVNYFRYDYPEPADGSPFSVNIDVATCPWNSQNKLARVGLKAKTIAEDKRPATNLVFLIDVSGSMAAENKLPLVKQALNVLLSKMGEDDQIAIVTYAGEAGLKLNSTSGSQRAVIQQAIDSLHSGGSTNGAAGINIAYDTAIQSFIKGGVNRVILCTDGDFNVGVSDDNTLVEMIQEKAASGVFLSVFGFGMGNLKDAKLEKLADKGNGNYGYIDGLGEARKVFGEQLSGTLVTVAKDVKLQLEFNNSTVGAYRLIGYENRVLAAKDFDDDTKDAGEIGAGHTVTALYEIVPKSAWLSQAGLDPEKFDIVEKSTANDETKKESDGRLFTVKLRHKLPDAETSEKSQDYAAMNSDVQLSESNVDFRFAAAVASFGMQLRESKFRGNWTLQNVLSMADASLSTDRNGERTEFTDLVRRVMRIKGDSVTDPRLTTHETVAPATPAAELPAELSANDARTKATVDGKYRRLLKKIDVRSDVTTYGDFQDYGQWDGTSYSGHSDLPAGYWVWVYPNWYIWGDVTDAPGTAPAP